MTIEDGLLGPAGLPELAIAPGELRRARELALTRDHPTDLSDAVVTRVERFACERDRPAVRDAHGRVGYAELALRARRLATLMEREGVGPGSVVAVGGERGATVVAAFLATELLGALYLPVDGNWPARRVADVLGQAGAGLLLSTDPEAVPASLSEGAAEVGVPVVRAAGAADRDPWQGPARLERPDQPRYVLFTSGSTGRPKGAVVEHQGMLNHLVAKVVDLGLTGEDVVAQTAPLGFDISIWQMLCPLVVGGEVSVVADATAHDAVAFARLVDEHHVTVVELVPTMVRLLLDDLAAVPASGRLASLRWMLATGEELPTEVARRWLREMPQAGLVNAYGPTECSDDVTHHTVLPADLDLMRLPIGTPVVNTQLYVLRRAEDGWQSCEPGETGELFVGGVGVGRGYVHDHDRTRDAFFRDPFRATPTGRLYRTGDAVRVLPQGALQYLGRVDRQVKLAGVRMELGEIEAVLQRHPAVGAVAVVVHDFAAGRR
ncbi:amino acid adenylation domain-containing protein [Kitasatospora sp. NPDC053057]|uniref:amino acid adenylation domain-containing protein n=1 Tax=Kitasatospora sp. NPDC053057 TaxID=3364062 RepID=UPI0037C7CEEC